MSSNKQPKLEDQPIGVLRKLNDNTVAVRGADPPTMSETLTTFKEQNAALIANPDKFGSAGIKAMIETTAELERQHNKLVEDLDRKTRKIQSKN